MKALVLNTDGLRFEPDRPEPVVPDGSTRVKVIQAGICETDLQLVKGYMGFTGVLGHEFVGVAESGPLAGHRVVGEINCICGSCALCDRGLGNHCPNRTVIGILNHDGAFADSLIVPNANLFRVPDDMSDDLATLVEPVAAALQIPEQMELVPKSKAVVLGDGRLGNLCAQVLRSEGCCVTVVGKHRTKLQRLVRQDFETVELVDVQPDRDADVVVDCTGSDSGLELALQLVRPRGTVVMKTTVAGNHNLSMAAIVIDEITLLGSRCGPFDKAIAAIQNNQIDLTDFISARYALSQYEEAFKHAMAPDALKVVFELE
ncbi:MAG: alcohol dehydrogenase catalytic domain-containing protein [Planctomycetaceae bacterium]